MDDRAVLKLHKIKIIFIFGEDTDRTFFYRLSIFPFRIKMFSEQIIAHYNTKGLKLCPFPCYYRFPDELRFESVLRGKCVS